MKYKIPSWALALFACLLWSTAFVGVKYSISFAPPLFVAGVRFTLAGLVLIPFAGRDYLGNLKSHILFVILIGFLQTFLMYLFYFLALDIIKASTAAALIGLGPLVSAILGHLFIQADNFTPKKIFSFIIGILGVTIVSLAGGKNGGIPDSSEILGIALFILNTVAGGFSSVLVVKYKRDINSSFLTSAQLTIGGIMLLLISLITYRDINLMLPLKFYISLGWLTFVSAAGFSTWYYLLAKRRENLISMNIWKFVMPVTGGILGWIIMPDDSPNIKAILGMVIVALSIYTYYTSEG